MICAVTTDLYDEGPESVDALVADVRRERAQVEVHHRALWRVAVTWHLTNTSHTLYSKPDNFWYKRVNHYQILKQLIFNMCTYV